MPPATPTNSPTTATALRVMSLNVRFATAPDGDHAWPHRRAFLFDTIRKFSPDLLGVQEALETQVDELHAELPTHAIVGVGRNDGVRAGEFSSVAFRTQRFTQHAGGTFWLSETPDRPGSIGWDAELPRVCSWVLLRDCAADRSLLFANTHFDHKGTVAREESARLLLRRLPELAEGAPVILTGDFNATEDDAPYKQLIHPEKPGQLEYADSFREAHPHRTTDEASYHGFQGTTAGSRIDWIVHSRRFRTIASDIDRTRAPNGLYPSDHYPVTAILDYT